MSPISSIALAYARQQELRDEAHAARRVPRRRSHPTLAERARGRVSRSVR